MVRWTQICSPRLCNIEIGVFPSLAGCFGGALSNETRQGGARVGTSARGLSLFGRRSRAAQVGAAGAATVQFGVWISLAPPNKNAPHHGVGSRVKQ
jgi:hypothetical protein